MIFQACPNTFTLEQVEKLSATCRRQHKEREGKGSMEQKAWHQMNAEDLQQVLGVQPQSGLTEEQADERRKQHGSNELSEGKKISLFALFLNQFKDFMVLVLMGPRSCPACWANIWMPLRLLPSFC